MKKIERGFEVARSGAELRARAGARAWWSWSASSSSSPGYVTNADADAG